MQTWKHFFLDNLDLRLRARSAVSARLRLWTTGATSQCFQPLKLAMNLFCWSAIEVSVSNRHRNVRQNLLNVLEVSGLDQVVIEPRVKRTLPVRILAVTSHCDEHNVLEC